VLILSTTVTNGTNSFEAQAAQALGLTVNIVDPATWDAMTTAQFNSYKAIILGDPECGSPGNSSPIDPATQNNTVWGPAITGNVVIIGTDPSYHANNGTSGALTMIKDGIKFATSIRGHTGAYISLSCYYYNTASNTPVPLLDAFSSGGFTVEGVSSENAHITYTPPAFYGLTDTDVSNWSNSIHEMFDKHPPYFRELANNEDNIHPYILVSAANTSSARGTQPPLIFPFNKPTSSHPERWVVIQGFNTGTHVGTYQFAFDLQRADNNGNPCDDCTKNEPVLAAAAGVVVKFADEPQTGCVAIRHNSFIEAGITRWYFTIYCHLLTPIPVTDGQQVKRGDQIGQAWNTHTPATCSDPCPYHIHFALISATDQLANNNRRAEQPLYFVGTSVIKDDQGKGGYVQISFPWENMAVNEYGNPMWTIRRT